MCVAIIGLLWFLFFLLRRERVKSDLRKRLFIPLSVRWLPFGWWWGRFAGASESYFKVRYVDIDGYIHEARCSVSDFHSRVLWWRDDVVGRDESRERTASEKNR